MTWKIKGKIGLHFPNAGGNPNQDTYRIVYSSDGVQSNLQEIKKVYFLTPADASYISSLSTTEAKLAELTSGKYDVWERYWEEPPSQRTLVAGTQNVAIEYDMTDATEDLVINSIEIFTDSSSTSSAKIKILHESGLFIAAIDGDNRGSETEKYEMTGRTRSVNGLNITLYKGHKYYFVYQGNTNEAFYPAYFQGDTDGNYKLYANTTAATQITVYSDVSSLKAVIGHNENLNNTLRDAILKLNANEKFLWGGYQQQEVNPKTPAMVANGVYNRETLTGSYAGKKTTLADIASIPNGDYCLIDVNDTGFTNEAVYRKTGNLPNFTEFDFNDYSSLSASDKLAIFTAKLNGKTLFVTSTTAWQSYVNVQGLDTLKSGYTSDIEVNNNAPVLRTTLPSNPVEKCFYYINGNAWTDWHATGLYVYENNNYTYVSSDADGFKTTYLVISQIADYFTVINFSSIISFVTQPSYDYNFANKSVETPGKHFYLKLNNIEV